MTPQHLPVLRWFFLLGILCIVSLLTWPAQARPIPQSTGGLSYVSAIGGGVPTVAVRDTLA